jgi:hypothetical protein
MNQETENSTLSAKKMGWLTPTVSIILVVALVVGMGIGYFIRENSFNDLQKQVAQLKDENTTLKDSAKPETKPVTGTSQPAKTFPDSAQWISIYRVKIPIPSELGTTRSGETVIPLGSAGSYVVKSNLYTFDKNPNISILASTDAIVFDNFIRTGSQAITPDPNTLTPGNPLLINGVNFCSSLKAKTCEYDEKTNTAVFEKAYVDSKNNPYSIWGAAHFFAVSQADIGKAAAVAIARVSSNNQELIDWAKDIVLNSKKP